MSRPPRVKALSEYVEHHVKEEESTLFSAAWKTGIDLVSLGEELELKKTALEGRREAVDVAQQASARQADVRKSAHRSK